MLRHPRADRGFSSSTVLGTSGRQRFSVQALETTHTLVKVGVCVFFFRLAWRKRKVLYFCKELPARPSTMVREDPTGWVVYLLLTDRTKKRTYLAATINLKRRYRQHNHELKGGARSTRRATRWTLVRVVYVRQQRLALSIERKAKRMARSGVHNRSLTMLELAAEHGLTTVDYLGLMCELRSCRRRHNVTHTHP